MKWSREQLYVVRDARGAIISISETRPIGYIPPETKRRRNENKRLKREMEEKG